MAGAAVYTVVVESSPPGSPGSGHHVTQVIPHGAAAMVGGGNTALRNDVSWDRMRDAASVIFGSAQHRDVNTTLSRSQHSVSPSVSPQRGNEADTIRGELNRLRAEMARLDAKSEVAQYSSSKPASSPVGVASARVVDPKARRPRIYVPPTPNCRRCSLSLSSPSFM